MSASPEDFALAIERDMCERILDVLERGGNLYSPSCYSRLSRIPLDLVERFRAIRTRVLEADVYELLHGELPIGTVERVCCVDPWALSEARD